MHWFLLVGGLGEPLSTHSLKVCIGVVPIKRRLVVAFWWLFPEKRCCLLVAFPRVQCNRKIALVPFSWWVGGASDLHDQADKSSLMAELNKKQSRAHVRKVEHDVVTGIYSLATAVGATDREEVYKQVDVSECLSVKGKLFPV